MENKKLIKEAIKSEIRKLLKEEFTEIDELARIAKTLKIVDKDKAQEVISKFQGGKKNWIADMITKVIESGDEGIAQVALAKAIGKVDEFGDGRQQAINPEVRSLLGAGIFTFGEAGVPVASANNEPIESSSEEETTETETSVEDDDTDVEVEDEYEKPSEDDKEVEDEEAIDKASTSKATGDKVSKELDNVIKDLKKLAKEYTDAKKDGNKEKEKELVAKLKEKNKKKEELEKEITGEVDDEE